MEYNKYHNCLRVQITCDKYSDQRIDEIAEHCLKNGFDNVMLLINQEEFNLGHITIEKAKPWVEILKKAKEYFVEKGLTVSLNNWVTLGHADRGRGLFDGQDFQFLVDMNGREATHCVCPLGKNWQDYYIEFITYLVSELKPDTFWIEDDFRLHNHAPLEGIGCYCSEHMAYYNSKLGTNYTREEFVSKLSEKGICNAERKVWLDVNRDIMIALADRIAKAVKKANCTTDVGLMSSCPDSHCLEGRDWEGLLGAFSQGGTKIHRIHLPYFEPSGKTTLYEINSSAMAIRSMAGDDVVIMPEMEHGSATFFEKSPKYFKFCLEASLPLILSGMTYSIYDFIGNGVRDYLEYGSIVKKLQPYMQAVRDLNISFSSICGVTVPVDQKACYYREVKNGYMDIAPTEYHAGAYLSAMGISYRYSTEKTFNNQTVFLTGSNIDYFSNDELNSLFRNNFVLLDGGAVLSLKKRNLLNLICADNAQRMICDSGAYSYEEITDSQIIVNGIRGLRASGRMSAGDAVKVEYSSEVEVCTKLYDHNMNCVAPCFVRGDNFTVFPFFIDQKRYSMLCDLRTYLFTNTVKQQKIPVVITDTIGISPYLYKRANDYVLILENSNVDYYDKTVFSIKNIEFDRISSVSKNGEIKQIEFNREEDKIIIDLPFEHLSSQTFILE